MLLARLLLVLLHLHVLRGWKLHMSPPAEQPIEKRSGDNFMVVCSADVEDPTGSSIEWYSSGQDRPIGSTGRIMTISKSGGTVSKQLMFVKPTVRDSGTYECVVKLVNGEVQRKSVNLLFIQAAKFIDVQKEQHPEEGKDAEIICRVNGNSSVEIFWQFKGNNIAEGGPRRYEFRDNNQVLIIPKYEAIHDDGEYLCNLAQLSTFETLAINVTGYERPSITIFDGPSENRGFEGGTARIQCQAVGRPKPEYKWTKKSDEDDEEEEITASDKYFVEGGLLEIHSLVPSDAGTYKCTAVNALDEMSRTLHISIFRKPRIERMNNQTKTQGDTVILRCNYAGDGKIKAKWVHQGVEYAIRESDATAEETVADDGEQNGIYSKDFIEGQVEVDATGSKQNEMSIRQEEERKKIHGEEGFIVLTIDSVVQEDAGQYQCVAKNEAGTDQRSTFLAITHPPSINAHSEKQRAFIGARIELWCEASAVPDPTWTWEGPSGPLEADGSRYLIDSFGTSTKLSIASSTARDYGKYICSADNEIGDPDSAEIEVMEIFVPEVPTDLNCDQISYPNYGKCKVRLENDDAGHRPNDLTFFYVKAEEHVNSNFDWEEEAANITHRFIDDPEATYGINGLEPSTTYVVRVRAANEAGVSGLSEIKRLETTEPRAPATPSQVRHDCPRECIVSWEHPNDNGSPIIAYQLNVTEIINDQPVEYGKEYTLDLAGEALQKNLSFLKPHMKYEVKLVAINQLGTSMPHSLVFKTSEFTEGGHDSVGVGSVRIVLAGGFVLLFLLLVIDLICFATSRCGLLACFCINCLGRNIHSGKGKDVEQGSRSESNRLLKEGNAETGISSSDEKAKLAAGGGPQSTSV